jgi:hypothetical protein
MIFYEDHGFRYLLLEVDHENGIIDAVNVDDSSPIYIDYHKIDAAATGEIIYTDGTEVELDTSQITADDTTLMREMIKMSILHYSKEITKISSISQDK